METQGFKKLPVTVLSGFLGSGKTTLLKHLLESNHGMKIAMIVQDMASINIDADRIRVIKNEDKKGLLGKMVQLQNGCICCSLREDLVVEIKKLAEEQDFDYLLIESTGVAEPMHVAEAFTFGELDLQEHGSTKEESKQQEDDGALSDIVRLDCMVTVMDVKQFFDYLQEDEDAHEKWGEDEEQRRPVCALLIDQLEFADVILLNKTDLVSKEQLEKVEAVVSKLNPGARILKTLYSKADPKNFINTGLFDFQKASLSAGWLKELREETPMARNPQYGITSFIYRRRRPFNAERLAALLFSDTLMSEGVIRSKGSLWLDCSYDMITEFDISGASVDVQCSYLWFAELREKVPEEWEKLPEDSKESILADFKGKHGDRRTELVMIGIGMNESKIRGILDQCFVTDKELEQGKGILKDGRNPFFPADEEEEGSDMSLSADRKEDESDGTGWVTGPGHDFFGKKVNEMSVSTDREEQGPIYMKLEFGLSGLVCEACQTAVFNALKGIDGIVETPRVTLKAAHLVMDATKTSVDALTQEIEDTGFNVTGVTSERVDVKESAI